MSNSKRLSTPMLELLKQAQQKPLDLNHYRTTRQYPTVHALERRGLLEYVYKKADIRHGRWTVAEWRITEAGRKELEARNYGA